ncbi:histidinol-phosphatase [Saccharicrinis fermentans]|uniref:Histidinol-phosphatase n=1 Tax=Saccharicrinis fermentans DSM 9555 = JCM 21142 TaxID=869213 RepID=W7Y7Q9_9BACT|nr:histidinol-phosphatase [Saccharicrinis fermentans]GAF03688.1 histidinol-phosphatase [Saccharicrinis fermentans DSM 9555 = JCM 21142]
MGWTNYHGHCNYCDGNGQIEAYIQQAIKYKMKAIGISSHAPVPFECFWTMKANELGNYLNEIAKLKFKYQSEINVLTGLEIDYIPHITGPDADFLKSINLDYKIGSIHFVDHFDNGTPWAVDGSFYDFKDGLDKIFKGDVKALVQRFFQLSREMIRTQHFDIIGHFDKIKMHNVTAPQFDENDDWYLKEIDDTLNCIAQKNIIVEINTKSYERNGLLFPGVEIFPLLLEKGIPVTINSDAHYPEKLEVGYAFVAEALSAVGFKVLKEWVNGAWCDVEFNKQGLLW